MASLNLPAIRDLLVDIAYEAGAMMLAARPDDMADPDTKLNSVDLVTQVDKAVEVMVSTRLKEAYPEISVCCCLAI